MERKQQTDPLGMRAKTVPVYQSTFVQIGNDSHLQGVAIRRSATSRHCGRCNGRKNEKDNNRAVRHLSVRGIPGRQVLLICRECKTP